MLRKSLPGKVDKICFIHIPKTAGSSVCACIESDVKSEDISSLRFEHEVEFCRLGEERKKSIFRPHASIMFLKQMKLRKSRKTYIFTILRDPVERIESLYNFWKYHGKMVGYGATGNLSDINFAGVSLAADSKNIQEFINTRDPRVLREISNSYCRYLSGNYLNSKKRPLSARRMYWIARKNCALKFHKIYIVEAGLEILERDLTSIKNKASKPNEGA